MKRAIVPLILAGFLQCCICQFEENGSGEGTELVPTTAAVTTTQRPARDITNVFMPSPTNISVVERSSESVTLQYTPPDGYLNDPRYTHFRVEYSRRGLARILRQEIPKSSDRTNLLIINLQAGALYQFRMKSQGRNLNGDFVVSDGSKSVNIRTLPPAVKNLKAQQLITDRESVIVSWDGLATSLTGPMYNKFVLKYYNIKEPGEVFTKQYNHQNSLLSLKAPTNISHIAENLVLGDIYNFTVYTESEGEDPTSSEVIFIVLKMKIPGPIDLAKREFTATSIQVSFNLNSFVKNVSGYRISFSEVDSGQNQTIVDLGKDLLTYNLTGLKPGAIYLIRAYHIIDSDLTEPTTIYARTLPTPPKNLTVSKLGSTSVELTMEVSLNQVYSMLLLQYEFVEKQKFSDVLSFDAAATSVTVKGLVPGGLYNIVLTYISSSALKFDETNASSIIQVRTIPNPPSHFTASSRQGKIILNWERPVGIERPVSWSYEIHYYPTFAADDKPTKVSLWNRDGASKMFHSLDNIIPGTSYTVFIYTIAGNAQNPLQARSRSSNELIVLSQPQNPRIDEWVQVSLKLLRLIFTPPSKVASNFDYYLLNITRIRSAGSSVEYLQEFTSYKIDKTETSKLLELTPGGTYRAVLTTVVGDETNWLQSVVNSSNSKAFNVWSPYDTHLAFARLRWNFNNCEKNGREGPSQIKCDASYRTSNLKNLVRVKKGIQYWVVPMDGLYRITGAGAGYEGQGGLGATVSGIFHLKEGSQLKIAIGQKGAASATDISNMAQGGAGGTFVVADDNNDENEPLLVAGGAGSCKDGLKPNNISNGQLSHDAADASFSGPRFGKGGRGNLAEPGLKGSLNTAGGAGFRGVSESFVLLGDVSLPATGYLPYGIAGQNYNDTDARQYDLLLGGVYEAQDGSWSQGGFGGGGNGYIDASGGGGGYTGGGGGPINGYSGGGGSYIKFTGGLQYAEVTNSGAGFVQITLVGLPVSSPVPLTLYLVVAFFVGILFTLCCGGLLCLVDKCIGSKYDPKKSTEYINMLTIDEPVKPEPATNIFEYETSVRVVSTSPPASGLYVQDIPPENDHESHHSKAKSSDSSSDNETTEHVSSDENEYNIDDSKMPLSKWEQNLLSDSPDDEDSKSESTASSVSSMDSDLEISAMGTDLDTTANDDTEPVTSPAEDETSVYTGTSSESEDSTSSSSGENDGESTLPPTPPPPPKAEELLSEEQRAAFREKLKMFHEMQESSGAIV